MDVKKCEEIVKFERKGNLIVMYRLGTDLVFEDKKTKSKMVLEANDVILVNKSE